MSKWKQGLPLLLILLLALLLYLPGLGSDYITDDAVFVRDNLRLKMEKTPWGAFSSGYWSYSGAYRIYDYYRPLVLLSLWTDQHLYGGRPWGFHLSNIFLFLLLLLSFHLFLRKALDTPPPTALLATAFLAFHPLNAENIVWIVGRNEILYLVFGFLFLSLCALQAKAPSKSRFLGAHALFFLGLLSKETFLVFLPLLIVLDLLVLKKRRPLFLLSFLPPLLLFFGIRRIVVPHLSVFSEPGALPLQAARVLSSLGYYFQTSVFPLFYPRTFEVYDYQPWFSILLGALALLLGSTLLLIALKRRFPLLGFWLLYSGGFLLFLSLFSLRFFFPSTARYLTALTPPLAFAMATALSALRRPLASLLFSLFLLLSLPQILFNHYLFADTLRYNEFMVYHHPRAHFHRLTLAFDLLQEGRTLEAMKALKPLKRAKMHRLNALFYHLWQSRFLTRQGAYGPALKELQEANFLIRNTTEKGWIMTQLVEIYQNLGDFPRAEGFLREYLRTKRTYELEERLRRLLLSQSRWDEAEKVETAMREKYGYFSGLRAKDLRRAFTTGGPKERLLFYREYPNPVRALEILNQDSLRADPFSTDLLRLELLYRSGRAEEGGALLKRMTEENKLLPERLNLLGSLLLSGLARPTEASSLFRRSLSLREDPRVRQTLRYISLLDQ